MASVLIDLVWPIFLLLGIETVKIVPGITLVTPLDFEHYPFSHSLVAVAIWALGFGLVYFLWKRNRTGAMVLALLVLSHWVLDLVVHRPDLPLTTGESARVGLGLWNSYFASFLLEFGVFYGGFVFYLMSERPRNRTGLVLAIVAVVLLTAIYLGNVFGPPPPNETAIAIGGLGQWLFVGLFYWLNRNFRPTHSLPSNR